MLYILNGVNFRVQREKGERTAGLLARWNPWITEDLLPLSVVIKPLVVVYSHTALVYWARYSSRYLGTVWSVYEKEVCSRPSHTKGTWILDPSYTRERRETRGRVGKNKSTAHRDIPRGLLLWALTHKALRGISLLLCWCAVNGSKVQRVELICQGWRHGNCFPFTTQKWLCLLRQCLKHVLSKFDLNSLVCSEVIP